MKKALLFLVCCLGMMVGRAQLTWCPAGANWHYGESWMNSGGYIDYKYEKDTILLNTDCKKIKATTYDVYYYLPGHVDTSVASIYSYAAHDTVFFYSPSSHQFFPYYYFNASVGDSLIIAENYGSIDSMKLAIVDSTGTLQINNQNLRYYVFHLVDTCSQISCCGFVFRGKVIESLGMVEGGNLIPSWHCVTDDLSYNFRCYEDSSFALYPANANCYYLYLYVDEIKPVAFSLSPNPATDQLNISIDESLVGAQLNIYNTTGALVLTAVGSSIVNGQWSIVHLPAGIYIAEVKTKEASVKKRWVKM